MITEADLLAKVPRGLYIDGTWIDAEGGATMTVSDPSNGNVIAEIASASVADAKKANDPNLATLEADLAKVTGQRETMFKGETLRGLLLTTYGFSVLGEKAELAALVAFFAAAILILASIAGFAHALSTPRNQKI